MPLLPVDTAVVVEVGPLIDDTDFKTRETAIAYNESGMDVDLIKNSGTAITTAAITPTTGGSNDWTHKVGGVYELEITAAQNNQEGSLRIVGVCDGVLPFESPVYTVVPMNVYNSLVLGTDFLRVDVYQFNDALATTELPKYVWERTHAEASGVPAWPAKMEDLLAWMGTLSRNKRIIAAGGGIKLRNDADDGDVATCTYSDVGTEGTKTEWA